ncbi:hypothetical protein CCC_03191 [Paramagnetospirillum magnetotacticum MS-1]|uniref:Uncharacterized protein n=1 Tax=Paramagnetospirillum magnetotacticum MS-1 TaxID=272627 RepID=A0A0C2YZU0_PARME|nr:hypothetical protein [Paramagnetospirillum magnetotacticum]KIM00589.1 hypothetical protein CCC_03191 [Paramagnetospirillum magnetotacticum MS-1]
MSTYRISYIRSTGWTRLGLAGAVAVLFASPMMWAMGTFGAGDDALHRAVIFALSGLWFFVGTFYVIGWALQGFVIRQKVPDEEADEGPARRPPTGAPPPPAARPPARPSGH